MTINIQATSILVAAFLLPLSAQAEKTYTPQQLTKMIQAKKYPAQGPLNRDETITMGWVDCLTRTSAIIDAISPNYPSVKLVDTKLVISSKIWANDSAMTVTCYADGRLKITAAPYK